MVMRISNADQVLVLSQNEFSALNSLLYELAGSPDKVRAAGQSLGANEVEVIENLWYNIHGLTTPSARVSRRQ